MGTGYRVLACIVFVLGCLVIGGATAAGEPPAVASDTATDRDANGQIIPMAVQQDGDEPSLSGYAELRYEVTLAEDGTAAWTVEYRYRLDDEESVDWEELQADIEDRPTSYLEAFEEDVASDVAEAEAETDRNMLTTGFTIETDETSTAPEYGYVRIAFEWDSFAHVEVNRIEVGDALGWLELDERVIFDVSWPEEYNETTVEPTPDDRRETAAIWHGEETDFRDDEPRIEVIETGGEPIETNEGSDLLVPFPWLLVAGAAVLVVAGAGWWMTRGDDPTESAEPTQSGESPQPDRPPPELLSNEERVLWLLEEQGGRMKQQEVVSELEWTEAKTSQVVGQLREDGEIEVFRIGRENVLALPEED